MSAPPENQQQKIYDAPPLDPDFYFTGLGGKRVLDLGCGAGKLGEHFKNSGGEWYGITISEAEAVIARTRLKEVLVHDLDLLEKLPFPADFFDAVILADVLEHLKKPERILQLIKFHLKPGGRIIASIPNIANFKVRFRLLAGKFQYEEFGILDNTHLRFYTLDTAKQLIASAGYRILDVKFTSWNWKFPAFLRPYLTRERDRSFRRSLLKFFPGFFATQFVIDAERQS